VAGGRLSDRDKGGREESAEGPAGADSTVPGPEGPQGQPGNDGRGIANVRDTGDGTTYGPFTVANGPAGMNGNDGRGISNIRDNGDGTLTVDYTDGNTAGPFAMPAGPQGPAGNDGAPGEVSAQQLSDAIASTSANSNSVQTLDESADQAAIIAKINELIAALRR